MSAAWGPSATQVPWMSSRASLTHASWMSPYAAGSRMTKRAPPLVRSAAPALLPLGAVTLVVTVLRPQPSAMGDDDLP